MSIECKENGKKGEKLTNKSAKCKKLWQTFGMTVCWAHSAPNFSTNFLRLLVAASLIAYTWSISQVMHSEFNFSSKNSTPGLKIEFMGNQWEPFYPENFKILFKEREMSQDKNLKM